ncbi:MAG: hypothetical protein IMF01_09385 [Proteobacteria bacterium]|nr:hypothetical protein [Pseudomonadota bacterium]
MTQVKKKFLTDYDIGTLRDVDYLGATPDNNASLRFDGVTGKWVPSKLSPLNAAIVRDTTGSIKVNTGEVLALYSPKVDGECYNDGEVFIE